MFGPYNPPPPKEPELNIYTIEQLSKYLKERLDKIEEKVDKVIAANEEMEEDIEAKYKKIDHELWEINMRV